MRFHSRAAMPIPLSATAKITQPSWHDDRTEIRLSRPVYLQRCRAGSAARQQGRPGRPTAAAGRDSPRPRHAAPVHAAVRAQLPSKAAAVKAMARYESRSHLCSAVTWRALSACRVRTLADTIFRLRSMRPHEWGRGTLRATPIGRVSNVVRSIPSPFGDGVATIRDSHDR